MGGREFLPVVNTASRPGPNDAAGRGILDENNAHIGGGVA